MFAVALGHALLRLVPFLPCAVVPGGAPPLARRPQASSGRSSDRAESIPAWEDTPYATGCAGTAGFVPALTGFGCPAPGQPIGLALEGGLGGAPGALAVGLGQGQLLISPLCSASIAPLTSIFVPFVLDGLGAGAGKHLQLFALPPGLGPVTVSAQAGIRDFGGPGGISATKGLSISIR